MPSGQWLLLLLQLPTQPASVRIKTWRRLQQLGSVAIKNSVYALPNTAQAREDFEWLKAEILAAKGQAAVMAADALSADTDAQIRRTFLKQRRAAYDALRAGVDAAARGGKRRVAGTARLRAERALRAGRNELSRLDALELTPAEARAAAVQALDRLEARLTAGPERSKPMPPEAVSRRESFRGRTWVTRPRPGVDRMSSAWLIRRFIDPKARFAFAHEPPGSGKQVAFDMFGGGFGHEGDRCTFEVLCDQFGIADAAVREMAAIVHDVDLKDQRFGAADAPAVGRMVEGLRATYADDHQLLTHGMALFAALYESLRQQERAPARPRRRARRTGQA